MSHHDLEQVTDVLPQRSDEVLARELSGEVVLYLPDASAIHVLNRTAYAVWELCDGAHTVLDIAQIISAEFSAADGRDVEGDVRDILAIFAQKGLLRSPL